VAAQGARRQGQLLRRRSDLLAEPFHGDIAQGLERLEAGAWDAIIFAAADLELLGLGPRISERFDHDQMIPAPGQGAMALETRAGDDQLAALLAPLHDANTAYAVAAERACLAALNAGLDGPVGVHAISDGEGMVVYGIVLSADGTRTARMQWSGPARNAVDLGETLAELLKSIGADKILAGEPIPPTGRYSIR
jgi:hydroxymethylbilane synthase